MNFRIRLWLLLLITLTLAASVAVSSWLSGQAVDQATTEVLDERIVALDLISRLESDIVEHERAYYRYYATAFEPGAALRVEALQTSIHSHMDTLDRMRGNDPRLAQVRELFARVTMYGDSLVAALRGPQRDWDEARDLLAMVTQLDADQITPVLDAIEQSIREQMTESVSMARENVDSTGRFVLAFAALVVLAGMLIAIYVERFVRETAERRRLAEFPERNPDAVLTLDRHGRISYANPASAVLAARVGQSADPAVLLPDRIAATIEAMHAGRGSVEELEYQRGASFLRCSINYISELELAHLHIGDVSARRQAQDRLQFLAEHDDLTGLGNRRRLDLDLAACAADSEDGLTLMMVLPDRFSLITASNGFAVADTLIQTIARELSAGLQAFDPTLRLYRLDGAQFAVLLSGAGQQPVAAVIERVQSVFDHRFEAAGASFYLSASIGYAGRGAGIAITNLLRDADAALQEAVERGGACALPFETAMGDAFSEAVELESALRTAFENDELSLAYQPQCTVDGLRLVGFEALLRWQSADLGMVSPARFVPLAEASGLIVRIGIWVLEQGCRQALAWQQAGHRGFRIAINVSPRQLVETDFVDQVRAVLQRTGVDPALIQLEITESAVMQNIDQGIRTLERLRALGLDLALDDFGTGQASMSYLKRLPINKLKIDQSFLRDVPDDARSTAIVRAIVELGQQLGLALIAEGVETEEQIELLKQLSCEVLQGYWYARPVPAADAQAFFDQPSASA